MIPYIGSKSPLKDFILTTCPPNPKIWVEPFGGMFSVFFKLDLSRFRNTRFIFTILAIYT